MVNKNELLYVVDEFDQPQKPQPRHLVKKNGYWFRAVHVWIFNDKNQILCQKRSLKKDISPGKWEPAVTGHISPEETYFTGAVREVREETGLPVTVNDLKLVKIYIDRELHEYRGIFYCKMNTPLHQIKREQDEVEAVKLLSANTLKRYLNKKPDIWVTHDYAKEIFSILN
jgi:isopentenyl-diphosphate delta-isomerase